MVGGYPGVDCDIDRIHISISVVVEIITCPLTNQKIAHVYVQVITQGDT